MIKKLMILAMLQPVAAPLVFAANVHQWTYLVPGHVANGRAQATDTWQVKLIQLSGPIKLVKADGQSVISTDPGSNTLILTRGEVTKFGLVLTKPEDKITPEEMKQINFTFKMTDENTGAVCTIAGLEIFGPAAAHIEINNNETHCAWTYFPDFDKSMPENYFSEARFKDYAGSTMYYLS